MQGKQKLKAHNMKAERVVLDIPLLNQEIVNTINTYGIKSVSYKNAQTSISGACTITLSKTVLLKYKTEMFNFFTKNRFAEVQVYITNQNQKWLLINGIINVLSTNLNYAKDDIVIVISHKTSIMRIQYIEAFEVYNEDELNANSVIDRFLIKNNFTTLYDYKIPLSKKSKIDSKLYASENQLAYDYLTTLINDCGARLFTEVYRNSAGIDKTVLYFYDTAELLLKYSAINECTFNNNNTFEIEYEIDSKQLIDKVIIASDDTMDGTSGTYKTILRKNVNTVAKSIVAVDKPISIPDIVYVKKIKSTSNDVDSSQYANSLIKESINDGFVLSIKTNSIFTNLQKLENGIFKLGMKALVSQSTLITDLLKENFQRYIDATENYFVITSIEYEYNEGGIDCVLNLVPNDIIQL